MRWTRCCANPATWRCSTGEPPAPHPRTRTDAGGGPGPGLRRRRFLRHRPGHGGSHPATVRRSPRAWASASWIWVADPATSPSAWPKHCSRRRPILWDRWRRRDAGDRRAAQPARRRAQRQLHFLQATLPCSSELVGSLGPLLWRRGEQQPAASPPQPPGALGHRAAAGGPGRRHLHQRPAPARLSPRPSRPWWLSTPPTLRPCCGGTTAIPSTPPSALRRWKPNWPSRPFLPAGRRRGGSLSGGVGPVALMARDRFSPSTRSDSPARLRSHRSHTFQRVSSMTLSPSGRFQQTLRDLRQWLARAAGGLG